MNQYNLTQKQLDVYNYVKEYIATHNKSPYIREIQAACGINSYKIALDRLSSLEKKGYISRPLNKHRSIVLNNVSEAQTYGT